MPIPAVAPWLLAAYISAETLSLTAEPLVIRDRRLPREFDGFRIAFAADLHHGPMCGIHRIERMIKKIVAFEPDVVIFGGDFLQALLSPQKREQYLQSLAKALSKLHPPNGIYGVLGNHDYGRERSRMNRLILRRMGHRFETGMEYKNHLMMVLREVAGMDCLDNRGVWIERGAARIRLGGVGDLWFGQQDLVAAKGEAGEQDFFLLMSHQPNYFDQITPEDNVALVLAGHTHGGQLTGFNYLPVEGGFKWRYRAGLVKEKQGRMLVSSGVGNEVPYVRFFAPPKIHLLTLKTR